MSDQRKAQAGVDLLIEGATVIAYTDGGHARLDSGVVGITGDTIVHVGHTFQGAARRRIDGRGKIVIPGQISTHAHIGAHEGPRLLIDAGRREFLRSGFLHFLPVRRSGGPGFYASQDSRASLRYGFATLVRHGVTTVLAFGPAGADGGETMLETAHEFGIRLVWSPIASGGRYWLEDDGRVVVEHDAGLGSKSLAAAAKFIERHRSANDGRYSGVIVLDEFHVSTPSLRREAKALARSLNVPFSMHFLEQHREFFDTMGQTGRTPVQLLAEEGILDAATILAHTIYVSTHSLVSYPMVDDIALLGESGVTVAHSPVAFSRRGVGLESFDRYRKSGVRVTLGTDTYPLDMFSEMRMAALFCKYAEKNFEAGLASSVFNASNLAGSEALGRPDLGRIAPGAKADLVIIDPGVLAFGINPDPIRALVHLATPDLIHTVMVGGRILVENKVLLVADEKKLLADVAASSERVWSSHSKCDPAGREIDSAYPPAIPTWQGG